MKSLFQDIRNEQNIFSAWRHVKRSALNSENLKIKGEASVFEHAHQSHLRKIIKRLREGSFEFAAVEGVLKDKKKRIAQGKDPRPIAISNIEDRVVQRAILQVLQPREARDLRDHETRFVTRLDKRLGKINEVNHSRFGVGGLISPYGGVRPAIKIIMEAMGGGAKYFYQSDIRQFFTCIPTDRVVDFVRNETDDPQLTDLFSQALKVHLANREQLVGYTHLFPSGGIGVAQGSSLSAFAGNVLLFDLDHTINAMGVTSVRYIDDILIVSKDEGLLDEAVTYANRELKTLGFGLYSPSDGNDKAARGECANSINFLGCTIQPNRCVPSKASVSRMKKTVQELIAHSKRSIVDCVDNKKRFDLKFSKSATIEAIRYKLYGWQTSFDFCTDESQFRDVDKYVSDIVNDYESFVIRKLAKADRSLRTRIAGIPSTAELYRAVK